jgi:hypothetical protein
MYFQTMQMQRKKEIYDIWVKFGASNPIIRLKFSQGTFKIIIVEDDPYYFLRPSLSASFSSGGIGP